MKLNAFFYLGTKQSSRISQTEICKENRFVVELSGKIDLKHNSSYETKMIAPFCRAQSPIKAFRPRPPEMKIGGPLCQIQNGMNNVLRHNLQYLMSITTAAALFETIILYHVFL